MHRLILIFFCCFSQVCISQDIPNQCNTVMPQSTISPTSLNVLGTPLQSCCMAPTTGFFRDGFCHTGPTDRGVHIVCAKVTADFLAYTKAQGNDLSTPNPYFPGLQPGDHWCLCVSRWKEALKDGHAPPIVLEATHQAALKYVSMEVLTANAVPVSKKD